MYVRSNNNDIYNDNKHDCYTNNLAKAQRNKKYNTDIANFK